ncbi:hypothetical protein OOZ15_14015 [Galbibacter sp. EGI 63066]|uniref:hypothetical protein n=1 Tax=Galbibacter sp. EGI 63066 TaxID=2993559 RepID=UPI002248A1E3|nr:hypothetical protein [Galbibacter sp. EGI 63066]MCX2681064.1 hypothetical protein [Galbibacter sp. EGI 63066]
MKKSGLVSCLIIGVFLFLTSCATSMSPVQVNNTLPTLTKSKFISQAQAEELVKTNKCKYLTKGRNYVAPIGFTVKDDLKNGAKGIDEWVELDGGNAYVLTSYKWITVNDDGATQLHIDFDTMLCE